MEWYWGLSGVDVSAVGRLCIRGSTMIQEYIAVRRMTQGHNLGICQMPDNTVSIIEIL